MVKLQTEVAPSSIGPMTDSGRRWNPVTTVIGTQTIAPSLGVLMVSESMAEE